MNDMEYETLVEQLGNLREYLRVLSDEDFITASYKGYSASGLTLDEVTDEMKDTEAAIRILENQLEEASGEL